MPKEWPWKDKPILSAAFNPPGVGGPDPITQEYASLMEDPEDVFLIWGGATGKPGHEGSWLWLSYNLARQKEETGQQPVFEVDPAGIERILSPLAHEARVRLMLAMHDGAKTSGQLSEASGLKGGNLYYHLKELIYARYVREADGAYDLTRLGYQMLLTVSIVAKQLVSDQGEEGLVVKSPWKGEE